MCWTLWVSLNNTPSCQVNMCSFLIVMIKVQRKNHLTDSRWPNEYDRKIWTWPKNSQRRTLPIELDQKYNKYYQNNEHKHVYMTENKPIHVRRLNEFILFLIILVIFIFMFVVLMIFFKYIFGHIHPYFGSCSMVKVRWCNLSVKFQRLRSLVWIFIGHILTHFWSYWFGQNN